MKTNAGGQQLPIIAPPSDWVKPTELPDLRNCARVAIDIETRDDGLSAGRGPGWAMRAGHVCGVSAAWDGGSAYFPVAHPDSDCFDAVAVGKWLDDVFASGADIVMHNAAYDLGWLRAQWGIKPPAKVLDTSIAAVLVDENRLSYRLDDLCRWRGVPGKDERALAEAGAAYGYRGDALKGNLWRLPAEYVGPYAAQDAAATLLLAQSLDEELDKQELRQAYRLELDLLPMVHEMRWKGIRVDVEAAERAAADLDKRRDAIFADLSRHLGERVTMAEIGRSKWLERVHDAQGIAYPRTAKTGQGSFTSGQNGWMDKHPHWLPQAISRADKLNNTAQKFLRSFIIDYAHRGRVHPSINQMRGEGGGTRTTRFSYSDPALQQMPGRDEELGPMVRGCFLPEEGQVWCKPDFASQEVRLIVHFAESFKPALPRANEAGDRFRSDPHTDYHQMVADMTGLSRKEAKNVNFAKAYGAGVKKFATMTNMDEEDAKRVIAQYDEKLPFVKSLTDKAQRYAEERGYVRLIDGARVHYDRWEPAWRERGEFCVPCSREAAEAQWPGRRLRRADCRKSGNAIVQGSAARMTKLAMREMWKTGIVPLLQLHDEIDCSVSSEDEAKAIADMMRNAVRLTIPVEVDVSFGRSWGDAKHKWSEL